MTRTVNHDQSRLCNSMCLMPASRRSSYPLDLTFPLFSGFFFFSFKKCCLHQIHRFEWMQSLKSTTESALPSGTGDAEVQFPQAAGGSLRRSLLSCRSRPGLPSDGRTEAAA